MIKICIFSDSHGFAGHMLTVLEQEKPALYFFLGDGERDLKVLLKHFPDLPFYAVRGNCDPRSKLSSSLTCTVGGIGIFATHGHLFNVKYEPELDSLAFAAKDAGSDLVLFGHTHDPCFESHHGIHFLNPGSIGRITRPGYAVLSVDKGQFTVQLKNP